MPFAPEYVKCVLRENFEDAKSLLLDPLLAIHSAHLVMLAERGIVSGEDSRLLRDGLDAIDPEQVRRAVFDGTCEDLFFCIERALADRCGDAVAGRLHTARSRNDIDMTMYRMRQPRGILDVLRAGVALRGTLTSRLLGFSGPTGNTYGSIATVDYLLQNVTATAVLLTGLGRFVQDMLLWCTAEFACMRLGDGFVQGSSIMPQKRNPVALEHARAIGSRALGEAMAIVVAVHNTPFGDVVDTEDDLQPLVERMFHDAAMALDLVSAAMASAEFDAAWLERRAGEGWTTITELADTLVRDHGTSFGAAHAIARRVVDARAKDPAAPLSDAVAAASREVLGTTTGCNEAALIETLSPRHFVEVRRTRGGPAPGETARALGESRARLDADLAWLKETRDGLEAAAAEPRRRSAAL